MFSAAQGYFGDAPEDDWDSLLRALRVLRGSFPASAAIADRRYHQAETDKPRPFSASGISCCKGNSDCGSNR